IVRMAAVAAIGREPSNAAQRQTAIVLGSTGRSSADVAEGSADVTERSADVAEGSADVAERSAGVAERSAVAAARRPSTLSDGSLTADHPSPQGCTCPLDPAARVLQQLGRCGVRNSKVRRQPEGRALHDRNPLRIEAAVPEIRIVLDAVARRRRLADD